MGFTAATRVTLLFVAVLGLSGCSTAYVVRQIAGQVELLSRAAPIDQVRERPTLPPGYSEGLDEIEDILAFARRQGFAVGDAYQTFVDLGGRPLVNVVTACPPDRLEPYLWSFPVIGSFPYKGFFDRRAAERMEARLKSAGFETFLGQSPAFSSLGWFPDPVYSSFFDGGLGDRTDLLLHELTHRTVFFPGDTRLNESLATFTARRATELFLSGRPEYRAELNRYRAEQRDRDRVIRVLTESRLAIAAAFADPDRERRIAAKTSILEQLPTQLGDLDLESERYRRFDRVAWNLPILLTFDIYTGDVPALEKAWERAGSDLSTFLRQVARSGVSPE